MPDEVETRNQETIAFLTRMAEKYVRVLEDVEACDRLRALLGNQLAIMDMLGRAAPEVQAACAAEIGADHCLRMLLRNPDTGRVEEHVLDLRGV